MAKVKVETTVEEKLLALYKLQTVDSKIDKIQIVRGELPLEVEDLEDEIAGIETRVNKSNAEIQKLVDEVNEKKNIVKDALISIKKSEEQQKGVRNNREYDAISKEIEFQSLEIELSNKRAIAAEIVIRNKKEVLTESDELLARRQADLKSKQEELENIIAETAKEEEKLLKASAKNEKAIDERMLIAYKRVRGSVRNGLGVVALDRDSCGGCFNKIPHQRQIDIATRKKVSICEHCGRILVDAELAMEVTG
ncbi:MAG: putative nucleic acid-binding Zn-ribbon protein [Glaciecola sp.]|jgi:predicted  nucleic acid-binding Zn-ribbon protein